MFTNEGPLLTELSLQPKVEIFLWFSHKDFFFYNIKNDKYAVDRKLKFSCLPWNEADFEEFQFMLIKINKNVFYVNALEAKI